MCEEGFIGRVVGKWGSEEFRIGVGVFFLIGWRGIEGVGLGIRICRDRKEGAEIYRGRVES